MVSKNSNLANKALRSELLGKFLLFGQTEDNKLSNVPEASSNAIRDAVFATPILDKHIKNVAIVPKGTQALWKTGRDNGILSGMYRSDGLQEYGVNISPSNWFTWVSEGYIFVILQNVLDGNIHNDIIKSTSPLLNKTGEPFTLSEGIVAQCVGHVPDGETFNSYRKHITLEPVDGIYDKLNNTYTSSKTRATGICGSGNERRYGTCCLYYSTQHYDRIRGVTYDAGDFYRCTCTECYRCSEMAESLGMQYRFNKWKGTGVTGGTGENCLHCDSEDFPSNCGPCECSIEWNEKSSQYETVIKDKNISENTSAKINARIAKKNKEFGGCITSAIVALNEFSPSERKIPKEYLYQDISVPVVGDFDSGNSGNVRFSTELDSNGNLLWTGFQVATRGSGASFVEIDWDSLLTYLPNTTKEKLQKHIKIYISPLNGFALSYDEWLEVRTLLDFQILRSTIASATSVNEFNTVSIASGGGSNGGSVFAGLEKNESNTISLTTSLVVTNPDAAGKAPPSSSSKGGVDPMSQVSYDGKISEGTTIKGGSILYSKLQTGSTTVANIEATGLQKDFFKVGETLKTTDDANWTINEITRPKMPSGDELDEKTIQIHHTHPIKVSQNINQGTVANQRTNALNVQIYF